VSPFHTTITCQNIHKAHNKLNRVNESIKLCAAISFSSQAQKSLSNMTTFIRLTAPPQDTLSCNTKSKSDKFYFSSYRQFTHQKIWKQ